MFHYKEGSLSINGSALSFCGQKSGKNLWSNYQLPGAKESLKLSLCICCVWLVCVLRMIISKFLLAIIQCIIIWFNIWFLVLWCLCCDKFFSLADVVLISVDVFLFLLMLSLSYFIGFIFKDWFWFLIMYI